MTASGCHFIDINHNTFIFAPLIFAFPDVEKEIILKDSVWIGANVTILMGVEIGDYAIVGAGFVITKSIQNNEI